MSVVKVIMRVRKEDECGPSYATICMKKHWQHDGIMCTWGTWGATKFDLDDADAELFCKYLNETFESGPFEVVEIDQRHLATKRHEYWSDDFVNCGFKNNHTFRGIKLE